MAGMTQEGKVLKLLKEQGYATNVELNKMGIYRYSARVYNLRREGHIIKSIHEKGGLWRFVYEGEADTAA